jgi:ElaB/YqjD/DUF883 family membrane-anchored ribosome-binding protein
MADNETELPEGTDKIINGASDTGDGATGAGGAENEAGPDDLISGNSDGTALTGRGGNASGGSSGGGSGGNADRIIDRLRSGGSNLSDQAADKARGLVSQGLERGSEALANVGRIVGETADGLDERLGPEYGDYARRAAAAIEDAANSLADKDADELIDDTRNFVRQSPGIAVAGAAIVGFALARLVKTGLSRGGDDDDRGGKRRNTPKR